MTKTTAPEAPVARVLPLLSLPHLDRPFDYAVPAKFADSAQPGTRVRVKFAGRLTDAIVLERRADTDYDGALSDIRQVITAEPVHTPEISTLIEAVATRYAGFRGDLWRLAVPPRHARAEAAELERRDVAWESLGPEISLPELDGWDEFVFGRSFANAVIGGQTVRAAWQLQPNAQWETRLAELAVHTAVGGGGVLIVVPHQRMVDRVAEALTQFVSAKQVTILNHDAGHETRYRRFLRILFGGGRIVVGTRSAAWAPIQNLRLTVLVDDGDDQHNEPRAPYPHMREVLALRSTITGTAFMIAGYGRTAETAAWVQQQWLHDLVPTAETMQRSMPIIRTLDDSEVVLGRDSSLARSRFPGAVFASIKHTLAAEQPVLVQVPRRGYIPVLSCRSCGTPARCRHCHGPLGMPKKGPDQGSGSAAPTCRWCGRIDPHYSCPSCGSSSLRPIVMGAERTAEELGRAFPGVPVTASSDDHVKATVPEGARLVIATPGAEPIADGGYGAAIIADTWALLNRQDLRAHERALAQWMGAAALVRSEAEHGQVIVIGESDNPAITALQHWDAASAAQAELNIRQQALFPPAVLMAAIDGSNPAIDELLAVAELPAEAELLGPVELPPGVRPPAGADPGLHGPTLRLLIRVPRAQSKVLGHALRSAQIIRAAQQDRLPLRVQIDPPAIG